MAADLPFGSYADPESAVRNARDLCGAGAEAVKAEGGRGILEVVEAIVGVGIPFLGHLGMLPQRIAEEGGRYRIKGRSEEERQNLVEDALALERAGAFAIVLELVVPEVATEVTQRLRIPTIGIGAGQGCDGQILVTQDLTGGFPWFTPKHVVPMARTGENTREAVREWMAGL
jgi:3-methyl-2-oxobutanoate hydroxymethyltransferase